MAKRIAALGLSVMFGTLGSGCAADSGGATQAGFGPNGSLSTEPGSPQGPGAAPNVPVASDPNLIDDDLPSGGNPPPGTNPEDCDSILEVTYRDFTDEHPDFEGPFSGDEVRLTLIEPQLDAEGKPVFRDPIGCPWSQTDKTQCADWMPTQKVIESKASFDQWYRTVPGVNMEFKKEIPLTQTTAGRGVYVYESNEFFPLTPDEGFGPSPVNGQGRNYLFTTEIHLTFTYVAKQTFAFRGDDDLWIFINNKLALDLGSMHNPAEGVIDFDAQATELGITPGRVYRMDVFHAERHTQVSSFRIETNIGCFTPAPPRVL